MVIRSGDQLFFRAPMRSNLRDNERHELLQRFDPSSADLDDGDDDEPFEGNWSKAGKRALLAPIVAEFGYDIRKDKETEFQDFLAFYEQILADQAPSGVRYRGTYLVNMSTEKTAGNYRTIWTFRSVNALNRIGAALESQDNISVFAATLKRFRSLVEDSPGAGRSQQIYQVAWGAVRSF